MIPSLAPLFSGPLLAYADKLQLADGNCAALPATAFFQSDALGAFFDDLQARHGGCDRRALVSIWSKWYFTNLLAPVLAADLLLHRRLPIGLDQLGLRLNGEGRPQALVLADDGQAADVATAPFQRFSSLIDGHLYPLIDAFASVCRAAPRLFWSNAGNTFEFATSRIELHELARPGCSDPARAILASRVRDDGQRNPLFEPVTYQPGGDDEPHRQRRICCIRYRVPGVGYCSSCPIDLAKRH